MSGIDSTEQLLSQMRARVDLEAARIVEEAIASTNDKKESQHSVNTQQASSVTTPSASSAQAPREQDHNHKEDQEAEKCPICYGDLEQDDLLVLPCGHCMHVDCRLLAETSQHRLAARGSSHGRVQPGPNCPMCSAVTPRYFTDNGERVDMEVVSEHAMLLLDESLARGSDDDNFNGWQEPAGMSLLGHVQYMLQSIGMNLAGSTSVPPDMINSIPLFGQDVHGLEQVPVAIETGMSDLGGDFDAQDDQILGATYLQQLRNRATQYRAQSGQSTAGTNETSPPEYNISMFMIGGSSPVNVTSTATATPTTNAQHSSLGRGILRIIRSSEYTSELHHSTFAGAVEDAQMSMSQEESHSATSTITYNTPQEMITILEQDRNEENAADRYVIVVPMLSDPEKRLLHENALDIRKQITDNRGESHPFTLHVVVTRGHHFDSRQHIEHLLGARSRRMSCTCLYRRGSLVHRAHTVGMTAGLWQPGTMGKEMFVTGDLSTAPYVMQESEAAQPRQQEGGPDEHSNFASRQVETSPVHIPHDSPRYVTRSRLKAERANGMDHGTDARGK